MPARLEGSDPLARVLHKTRGKLPITYTQNRYDACQAPCAKAKLVSLFIALKNAHYGLPQ